MPSIVTTRRSLSGLYERTVPLRPLRMAFAIRPQSAARRPTSSHGVVAGGGGGGGGGSPPCDAAVGSSTWICSPGPTPSGT